MQIEPTDNILDVGCGAGWLSRILAQRVPQGRVVGMDISDEMIRHAREASVEAKTWYLSLGGVDEIPWEANFFSRVISVESSYYWPDPAKGLREIYRVLARRRLGVDSDQLLPRQSVLPSVGRKIGGSHEICFLRGMGKSCFATLDSRKSHTG